MKVTRNTPDQLILQNNPLLLVAALNLFFLIFLAIGMGTIGQNGLVGAIFIGGSLLMGAALNLAFARRTQLILDRTADRVELRRKSLLAYYRQVWRIADVTGAETQVSRSGDTDTRRVALRVHLYGQTEIHPVTLVYTSGKGPERATDAINSWLGGSR